MKILDWIRIAKISDSFNTRIWRVDQFWTMVSI